MRGMPIDRTFRKMPMVDLDEARVEFDRETGEYAINGVPVRLLDGLTPEERKEMGLDRYPGVYAVPAMVRLDDVYIPIYQRKEVPDKVSELTKNFNSFAANFFLGSYRPKEMGGRIKHVARIDGQQREAAARNNGIKKFRNLLIFGLTEEQESELFEMCNTLNEGATAYDIYNARRIWSAELRALDEVLAKHRVRFVPPGSSPRDGECKAVALIRDLQGEHGLEYVDTVLCVLTEAFGGYSPTLSETFIKALHNFLQALEASRVELNLERLVRVLRRGRPEKDPEVLRKRRNRPPHVLSADDFQVAAGKIQMMRAIQTLQTTGKLRKESLFKILAELFVEVYNFRLKGPRVNPELLDHRERARAAAEGKLSREVGSAEEAEGEE